MFEVFAMLIVCTLLSYCISNNMYELEEYGISRRLGLKGKILFFALIFLLVWFAGLRTKMNDTATYLYAYTYRIPGNLSSIQTISWRIGDNPLFSIYQIVLKSFVSDNGQVFLLITALIVELSMIKFLLKYSENFGFSVYLFMAFTVYAFTMAAMKQTLATAIAIWAMPAFLNKSYIKGIVIIIIASLIHPYVALLVSGMFIANKGIWNRTISIAVIATVIIAIFYTTFIGRALSFAALIGDDTYDASWFSEGTGVGVFRILSYAITPFLAFISRAQLKNEDNPMMELCINMSIIALCLSFVSSFGGATLFGRLPNYFDLFICLSIPYILKPDDSMFNNNKTVITVVLYVAYFVFYYNYYNKYFVAWEVPFWGSVYDRVSLWSIF